MTATPEQRALVNDPLTSASTLQELAAAEPELWPAIAAHPNVYADLLEWIQTYGPAETVAAAEPQRQAEPEPRPEPVPTVSQSTRDPLLWREWLQRRRKLLIRIGVGVAAAALALILVMTIVVAPMQAAAKAAAAADAAHDAAVNEFEGTQRDCEKANARYQEALGNAQDLIVVDPATLQDAAVVPALQSAIDDASDGPSCIAPAMAGGTADIEAQVADIQAQITAIDDALAPLVAASDSVSASVQAKIDADAAAAAEVQRQQQAALLAAHTWTMTDAQGYAFTAVLKIAAPTSTFSYSTGNAMASGTTYNLGDACSFDPSVDIAVPVTMTVTATTKGFDTPISALVMLTTKGRASQPHEVAIEAYFSDDISCKTPTYGSTILDGVSWADPMATGSSGAHTFVVIIRDWKTPATPSGDDAFLDNIVLSVSGGQNSGYSVSESKSLSLRDQIR